MCSFVDKRVAHLHREREGKRERSLLRLRGREEAGKRDESSSSAESFRNSFKSALRARIEWRSVSHHHEVFDDDDERIRETCHSWERRERHHHHHEEEEEQQNNNNKTRDEMSNVANGVVLAQRRENFRRREALPKLSPTMTWQSWWRPIAVDTRELGLGKDVISGDETLTSLAEEASLEALKILTDPEDIDLIIVATSSRIFARVVCYKVPLERKAHWRTI